ncbi:MAG: hypothetical protein WA966_09875 [Ornithinimicrobium sp.]
MARMQQLPRTRRRRAAVSFGWIIAVIGAAMLPAAVRNVPLLHPIILASVGVLGFGILLAWWGHRGYRRAAQADHIALSQTGSWDSLPPGAELRGERIGLRTMTVWTWLIPVAGVVMLLLGALIAGVSEGDTAMLIGGLGIGALGIMMWLVWAVIRGTVYWLDADGISRAHFPHTRVQWADIERIDQHKTQVILRTDHRVRSLGRRWASFTIATGAMEISPWDLVELIASVHRRLTETPTAAKR